MLGAPCSESKATIKSVRDLVANAVQPLKIIILNVLNFLLPDKLDASVSRGIEGGEPRKLCSLIYNCAIVKRRGR